MQTLLKGKYIFSIIFRNLSKETVFQNFSICKSEEDLRNIHLKILRAHLFDCVPSFNLWLTEKVLKKEKQQKFLCTLKFIGTLLPCRFTQSQPGSLLICLKCYRSTYHQFPGDRSAIYSYQKLFFLWALRF